MADTFVLQISRNWRIAEDDLQWILQRCKKIKRYVDEWGHHENWRGRSFCCTRKALIRCISEHVKLEADEDPGLIEAAVASVERFPEMHRPMPEPLAGVAVEAAVSLQQHERGGRDVA